jgi:hypothetical protein
MDTVLTEPELLGCFREIDRPEVTLAPELTFPLPLGDALIWTMGPRVFVVLRQRPNARPLGIVFHRNTGGLPDVAAMCEWCHAVRRNAGVTLMSVRADERRRVGLYLCRDIGCLARAHELPAPEDVNDRVDGDERARRTLRRMLDFATRRVF